MPFIFTSLPEAGCDINGVPFVPHPSGNGKVSVRSVDADLASIFCKVPGFETCPDPGFPSAAEPQPVAEPQGKAFESLTVDEHKAEIERLEALITEHQDAIIAAGFAALKESAQAPAADQPAADQAAKDETAEQKEEAKPAEQPQPADEAKASKKK